MAGLSSIPLHSCLYTGRVRHRRFTPVENAFTYSGYWVYLDLDELDRVFAGRWLWSASGPALARFSRGDHLLFPEDLLPGVPGRGEPDNRCANQVCLLPTAHCPLPTAPN